MKKYQIYIVLATLGAAFLVPLAGFMGQIGPNSIMSATMSYWVPLYVVGAILTLYFVLADLYERQFEKPKTKVIWILIILTTSAIGMLFYVLIHAIKPMPQKENS